MEFEGRLIQVLPEESGQSARTGNNWRRKGWVFETFGQYPRKVYVTVFNDRIDTFSHLQPGNSYVVSIDAESRDFNGRWYTDLRMYGCRDLQTSQHGTPEDPFKSQPASPAAASNPFGGAPAMGGAAGSDAFGDSSDDLPF